MKKTTSLNIEFEEITPVLVKNKILQLNINCNCIGGVNCNCNSGTNCNCNGGAPGGGISGTKICPITHVECTYNDCSTCPSNPALVNCSNTNCNCGLGNCNCNC